MTIQRFHVGPRMSLVAVHGGIAYLAGIVADNRAGTSVAEQTQEILAKIDGYLAEAGTDKSKAFKATVWLRDIKDFDELNSVWDKWIDPANPPVRACIESRMAFPDVLVEIQITAAV